jgi:2,4-dichlorophenol 6-monooxygenase
MDAIHTDVLIVGAGPAGLTASALLARQGVPTITISKYRGTANGPRAHVTNQRTIEVMRDLGIEREAYNAGYWMTEVPDIVWTTSLSDRELSRRRAWGTRTDRKGDYEASSPCHMVNIAQNYFEPVILNRAMALGADIRFNTELTEITQDADGVTATARFRPTGQEYTIRARYALGADGGRSTVASQAGFEFEGQGKFGYALNAYIEADLSHLVAHRPGVLYWTNHPGKEYFFGSGAFALVRQWNEWMVQFSYDPSFDPLEATEEKILPRIHTAIGDPSIPVKIKQLGAWELQEKIATAYRRGRIFIAGDAAHRHNPSNGLGSNTSIQDAYNISWKLAAVVEGRADDAFLDSYEAERLPVGQQIVRRATESAAFVAALPTHIGITAGQSEEDGFAAIDTFLSPTTEGRQRRQQVLEALDDWDYGINTHGIEMGQRYVSSAVIDDGPMPADELDDQLYYQPTTHSGAYLPHVWLDHHGTQVSTLDLVPPDTWTIITGNEGNTWLDSAEQLSKELGFPIAAVAVGLGLPYADVYGDWAKVREITDGGCLLIRPDKYIALRVADVTENPAADLRAAFARILHPEP